MRAASDFGDRGLGGVRGNRKVGVIGDNSRSKMESGEAGNTGDAMGNSPSILGGEGGTRNGLCGDVGHSGEVRDPGVSGSQYERGGTGGASRSTTPTIIVSGASA